MTELQIADGFSLPLDMVTEASAIVATRGAGKSSTSAVLVEEAFALDVQTVVFDRTGVYWGLRSNKAGNGPGLAVYVLGGPHGDVPLEANAGTLIADLVVDSSHSFVLDLSDFSKANAIKFAAHFLERLYDRKARSRSTTLLVIDEAHFYAPQAPRGGFKSDAAALMGAMEDVVGLGRSRGLGVVLTTQRTQSLNKAVLDLIETMFVMRMLSPRAREAVRLWIQEKHEEDERGVIPSLDSLPTGTAWVWAPLRGILERVAIRRIRTFDSYRTPKPGETLIEPSKRTELDLAALGEQMAATVERARENDPKELKRMADELRKELAKARDTIGMLEATKQDAVAQVERVVEEIKVPVFEPGDVEALQSLVGNLATASRDLATAAQTIDQAVRRAAADVIENVEKVRVARLAPETRAAPARPTVEAPKRPAASANGDAPALNRRAERMVLAVLAQYPDGRTKRQTAILAGYAMNGGGFNGALSKLRTLGLIEGSDPLRITQAGLEAIDGQYEPLPTGPALLDHWLRQMNRRAEREVLQAVYDAWPNAIAKEEVAAITGYEVSGGGFSGALSKLRTLELISGSSELRVADALRE